MKIRISATLAAAGACTLVTALAPLPAQAGVLGCSASGGKQEGGALIGAVVGGVAGHSLARGDRGTGTVLGAATGAAAGSYVGCEMQKSDAARPPVRRVVATPAPVVVERVAPVYVVEEHGDRGRHRGWYKHHHDDD